MKTTMGRKIKVIALSLLIIAMNIMMHKQESEVKYWIAFGIILVSLAIINYDFFNFLKDKHKDKEEESK